MRHLLVLVLCTVFSDSAKILGVFNHPGTSHTLMGKVLLKNLARKGHEVVMVGSFPLEEPMPNYKDIVLAEQLEDLQRRNRMSQNKAMGLQELKNMTLEHTEGTFTNPQVQEMLRSEQTFDLVIIDWFYNEATLIFGHIYKAPVIYLSSFGNMFLLNDVTGNTLPYSYVPGAGMYITDDMTFGQRLIMTLFNLGFNLIYTPRNVVAQHEILKRHFDDPPTIPELQKNVALVLSNSHYSIETPRPYTPNIIPVGGFHLEEPKGLPLEIKKFLDGAKEGAIFFSLGTQKLSSNLNEDEFVNITRALERLSQRVLWKFETNVKFQVPENVKVVQWVPQVDVLAHPNLKLFITHGGVLSLIEAIYHRVPLVCIPFAGDQLTNAAFIQSRQIGVYLSPDNMTEDAIFNTIKEIYGNPKYQRQVDFRSSLLKEQPVKPLDLAIYWVEHVIRFGRTDHLKTFAIKLTWYKYYMVDVIAFLVFVLWVLIKAVLLVTKLVLKTVFLSSRTKRIKRE